MKTVKIQDQIHKDVKKMVANSDNGETMQEFIEYAILAELYNRKKLKPTKTTKK